MHACMSCFLATVTRILLQIFYDNGTLLNEIAHPVRDSLAWQWVQESMSTNGMAQYTIKLGLETDDNRVERQANNDGGTVFFDDIDVKSTAVERTGSYTHSQYNTIHSPSFPSHTHTHTHTHIHTYTHTRDTETDESNDIIIIIIACSAAGGAVLLLVTIILFVVCCYLCCCRKGTNKARPMWKITTLVKKVTLSLSKL